MAAFYEPDGLAFRCTGCGDCCTGDPGYVWVNDEEIAALAQAKAMSVAAFEEKFVRPLGSRRSLFERFNGSCILFDDETRRCTVYEARPVQCRTWPFWPQNVESPEAWAETCRECPGSGVGDLHDPGAITVQLRLHADARRR